MAHFDIAIIGGGPAGYAAAQRAAAKGLRPVLFEARELGGVCLNEGCIPTKTLLYGAKTYENALHADKYGVRTEGVSFDYSNMVARKNKVVRKLVAGVKAKLHGVEIVREKAFIRGRSPEGFLIETPSTTGTEPNNNTGDGHTMSPHHYTASNLLICTGSEAVVPPIEGIFEAQNAGAVLTSREILGLKELPRSLVVVGGGVIGIEFASLFNSLGVQVTVIEQMSEILGQTDSEISAMLRGLCDKKGIAFHLSTTVTRIDGNDVHYSGSDDSGVISAEKILISVGRRPVTRGFGLEDLGIRLNDRRGIETDEGMRTNIPGVYAAGDVTGEVMLAHTAYRQAEVAVDNILKNSGTSEHSGVADIMRYDAIPSVVYTNPEVASVGLTLAAATQRGLDARELRLSMSYSGRFVAENEGGEGLCKVVVENKSDKVLGVHMIGNPASETIWGAGLAIERGTTVRDLQKIVFPHPSVSEIIREVLLTT